MVQFLQPLDPDPKREATTDCHQSSPSDSLCSTRQNLCYINFTGMALRSSPSPTGVPRPLWRWQTIQGWSNHARRLSRLRSDQRRSAQKCQIRRAAARKPGKGASRYARATVPWDGVSRGHTAAHTTTGRGDSRAAPRKGRDMLSSIPVRGGGCTTPPAPLTMTGVNLSGFSGGECSDAGSADAAVGSRSYGHIGTSVNTSTIRTPRLFLGRRWIVLMACLVGVSQSHGAR